MVDIKKRIAGCAEEEDSEEDNGRRGQPQWRTPKRAVFKFKRAFFNKKGRIYFKRSSLIERVVFDLIKRHIVLK